MDSLAPSGGLSLALFLLSVVVVSLSGVMMPGPVTAAIVAKGHHNSRAGLWVALGHGAVELPLITLIYLGLAAFFTLTAVRTSIGLAGGAMMLFLGWQMFRSLKEANTQANPIPYNSVTVGLVTTAANPGFFLWWATIGAALVANASAFGPPGVMAMAITHWMCDIGWDWLVSWGVFRSRRVWSDRLRKIVFAGFAVLLAGFGVWFIVSAVSLLVR